MFNRMELVPSKCQKFNKTCNLLSSSNKHSKRIFKAIMVITIAIALTSTSLVIISSYRSSIGLSLICLKIYLLLLFLPELPKIFAHYSYFIPIAPPIIPFLFYCANGYITMQENVTGSVKTSMFAYFTYLHTNECKIQVAAPIFNCFTLKCS